MNVGPRVAALALAVSLFASGFAPSLRAQSPDGIPIFLAIPERFPEIDARALVIREPDKEIILLPPEERSPEALAMALRVLAEARPNELPPGRGHMIPITGFVFTNGIPDEERRRLGGWLTQLRQQPMSSVSDLGPGRWVRYTGR